MAYQLYRHVQAQEQAEKILERQLRRLLMQGESKERSRWLEYGRSCLHADSTTRAGMQVISRAGATGDRLQRLRLLVHIGDFFTAYHEKKLSRALEILDDAGIFRNTTERREVQCQRTEAPYKSRINLVNAI